MQYLTAHFQLGHFYAQSLATPARQAAATPVRQATATPRRRNDATPHRAAAPRDTAKAYAYVII
jgi:hypothetical protein